MGKNVPEICTKTLSVLFCTKTLFVNFAADIEFFNVYDYEDLQKLSQEEMLENIGALVEVPDVQTMTVGGKTWKLSLKNRYSGTVPRLFMRHILEAKRWKVGLEEKTFSGS